MSELIAGLLTLVSASTEQPNERWVHLLPKGTFTTKDGRGPFHAKDLAAILRNTTAFAGKTSMVVDYEHQTLNAKDNGRPNPAAGWVKHLEERENGIWGLVEFTSRAAEFIRNREYRYISPVFNANPKTGEVGLIANIALVNNPALGDSLVPLSRKDSPMELDIAQLREILGLDVNATPADILEHVRKLVSDQSVAASVDLTKYVPMAEFEQAVKDANSLRRGMRDDQAKSHVDNLIRQGRLMPYLRDWGVQACAVNPDSFNQFVEKTSPAVMQLLEPQLGDRALPAKREDALDETSMQVCRNLGISTDAFVKATSQE